MISQRLIAILWFIAAASAAVLWAANLYLGDLNQDEGWYLYAARMVAEGRIPYRDFAFTQAPVMPFSYSLIQPLVFRFGVAGGRAFTAVLGLAGALLAARLAARLAGARTSVSALLAFVLIGVNVYQSYFTTVVKTYSLSALFLAGGFLLLERSGSRRARTTAFLSAFLFTLAAGTRVSAAVAIPVGLGYLALNAKRFPGGWIAFIAGATAGAGIVFLPFWLAAPEGFVFGVFQYHTARHAGNATQALAFKAGCLSRLVQAYFVACALGAGVLLARWCRLRAPDDHREPPAPTQPGLRATVWVAVLAVTVAHLLAPFPYEDYQAMIYPLFAAALAAATVRLTSDEKVLAWILCTVTAMSLASAGSSPINQDWFVQGRDRIWWKMREESPLRRLQRAADTVRALAPDSRLILTQDTYLAVEAGLRVPPGLELGPFSYYPDWDTDRARRHRVVNRPLLRDLLASCEAPVAALSGYSLAIRSPEVQELSDTERKELQDIVASRYDEVAVIPHFGQGATPLRILRRR